MASFGPVVPAEWLVDHLGDHGVRVVDLRWSLEAGPERHAYLSGHIPGAAFVDLDADLTAPGGTGRHPLPSRSQFEEAMRRAGVDIGSQVVVYDDAGGSIAARLWWLLQAFGHEAAAVLDGGIQAWEGPVEAGPLESPLGDFRAARLDPSGVLDYDELRREAGAILLDARSPERYTGQHEPVDARAGHIPGARSAFWKGNLGEDGRFRPPDQLRERYRRLGVGSGEEVIAYCGSGVTSCHDLLALELAGLGGGRLYPGSWSDWSSRPEAPVATGSG